MNIYESICFHLKYFGIKQAYNLVLYPRIADKIRSSNSQRYINNLLKFQRSITKDIVEKYRNVPLVTPPINPKTTKYGHAGGKVRSRCQRSYVSVTSHC